MKHVSAITASLALWIWPAYEAIHGCLLLGVLSIAIEIAGGVLVGFALLVLTPKAGE